MSLRSARIAAGLSVGDVAERLGVSTAAIYMWENGTILPKSARLPVIADLYKCSIADLYNSSSVDAQKESKDEKR